jgi:hypothetical protein
MNKKFLLIIVIGLIIVAGVNAAPNYAREYGQEFNPEPALGINAVLEDSIPIQGRLTDSSGNPLTGDHSLTLRLYDVATGGTALCTTAQVVSVSNGLFYTNIQGCANHTDGRQLYLGIQVGSDAEMTPRQPIHAVPYAMSLRPGAKIIGPAPLMVENSMSADGMIALLAKASGSSGQNYGVYGWSTSPAGFGGFFYNNAGGTGLRARSDNGQGIWASSSTGAAIHAQGKITSTSSSYLWVSGNDFRPRYQSDSTVIDMDSIGGAYIQRGLDVGTKFVMLPITIPSTLYGQNVRITALDIYWVGQTEFDGITAILMRRQHGGVCPTCYRNIVDNVADRVCDIGNNPTGCVVHFDLTNNNVLDPESGVVYLTLRLAFSGTATYVQIGGVRLTLEHQ